MGDNVGTEIKGEQGNDDTGNHVRTHNPFEGNTSCQHGDDFRIASQLGSEEDDGDEYEQGTKQVGEIRHEVHVIIKYYRLEWSMVLCEFRQVFVYVKHDGYGNNQHNGVDVCADKLLDDVPIKRLYISPRVKYLQHQLILFYLIVR